MSISGGQLLMVEVADHHSVELISTSAPAGMSAPAQSVRPRMSNLGEGRGRRADCLVEDTDHAAEYQFRNREELANVGERRQSAG
eukprot:475734-Pyramimonas_sp.AAC.1